MRRWRRTLALGLRACASRSGRTGRLHKYTMCVTYTNRTTTTAAASSSWAIGGARAAAAPARGPRRRGSRAASRGRPSRREGRGGAGRAGRRLASTTYCLCWLRPCLLVDERYGVFAARRALTNVCRADSAAAPPLQRTHASRGVAPSDCALHGCDSQRGFAPLSCARNSACRALCLQRRVG